MAGAVGGEGYYIKNYGPFKTKEIAEFFNFIAFVSPRSLNAEMETKNGIIYLDNLEASKHPKCIYWGDSKFSIWWQDTFGIPLTGDIIMLLAKECGASGYRSFTEWMVSGSKLNGMAPHCQYSSALA